jgi:hypothetical protein
MSTPGSYPSHNAELRLNKLLNPFANIVSLAEEMPSTFEKSTF